MRVKINAIGKPLSLEDLNKFESQVERMIPDSYKSFLLDYNGGFPEPDTFILDDKKFDRTEEISVEWFLGIDTKEYDDLRSVIRVYKDRIPVSLFPIALSGGDSLVCIGIEGDNLGKVFFWDREEEVEEGMVPTFDNVYFLANNFEEFINSLK